MTLACIVCGSPLQSAAPPAVEDENLPSRATVFTSIGNYGSGLFDPNITEIRYKLEINICDTCLREAAAANQVLLTETLPPQQPQSISKLWDLGDDNIGQ